MAEEGSVVDVEELKTRARSLELDGQLAEAFAVYRQILSHLEQEGNVGTALPLYVKAGDLAIKTGDNKGGLGLYGRAARRYAEAGSARSVVALCTKIVRASPANTYVYPRLARLMIERGHVDAAREVLVDYAAKTKQAKGREALERLAGHPDARVKAILEKLLDAAEKRERAVAERAKRAAAQAAPPAPHPEQPAAPAPEPAAPELQSAAPSQPEQSPPEVETAAPGGFREPKPAIEEAQPVTRDTSLDVEPEPPEEDIETEPEAVGEDVAPTEPAEEPERDLPEATAEPEPTPAEPEFEAPAIELDAEPQFEPPRLTPMPEPAVSDPADGAAGTRDEAEPAAQEVSAGGRMTDEPLIFAAQKFPKRSGKMWMILGAVAALAGAGGLLATGMLGGGGGGGDTPTQPAAPPRATVPPPPPTSDSGMPLALGDSLSRDSAAADSVTDSLATDSTALALLGDSVTSRDTVTPADTNQIISGRGDSAVGGAILPDSGPSVPDTVARAIVPDTTPLVPPPVVAPNPPSDTTPDAILAAVGRPAVIIDGLPILSVREIVSNGRTGVQVGQAHTSGEPISVVTLPLGRDTAAVGVITLPGDTAVGTTRMGNFLVTVRGRVSADTLAALLRRLTVARSN